MKRFMKLIVALGASFVLVTMMALGAGAGTALKTTGSVGLSGPKQYIAYDAFQTNPVKGSVSYTNFEYRVGGTGVWVPDAFSMVFTVVTGGSGTGTYAMSVSSFTPTSPTALKFVGTGVASPPWISTFAGSLSGSSFTLSMTEINSAVPAETYSLSASGTPSGGSVTGTWSDNYGTGRTGTFTIDGIGYEVFHYIAPVTNVVVSGADANFTYTIPDVGGLGGTVVTWYVTDGGQPAVGHDSLYFMVGASRYDQTPASGNLQVFGS